MADNSKYIDMAGNTLVISAINVSDTPGELGTALDLTNPVFEDVTVDSIIIDAASDITIPSAAIAAAGTGAGAAGASGGAVATHVLPITVGATTYYIPLCNTNAS